MSLLLLCRHRVVVVIIVIVIAAIFFCLPPEIVKNIDTLDTNLSNLHALYRVVVAEASPEENKMWAVVRQNGYFLHLRFE